MSSIGNVTEWKEVTCGHLARAGLSGPPKSARNCAFLAWPLSEQNPLYFTAFRPASPNFALRGFVDQDSIIVLPESAPKQ
jgi:hypothetical protein